MTEPRVGDWSQSTLSAASEARRLRCLADHPDLSPPHFQDERSQPERFPRERRAHPSTSGVTAERDALVLDWQLGPTRPASAPNKGTTTDLSPIGVLDAGDFEVRTTISDAEAVLRLAGELDSDTAPYLRRALDDLSERKVSTLVFELTELTFIDSSGLHELVIALERQKEAGGDVVIRGSSPHTRRVLDIVGLSQVLKIV